jgi:phosphatidylethanolamine/phosphatidyl-N-methylethanolamine N-methyltransferase
MLCSASFLQIARFRFDGLHGASAIALADATQAGGARFGLMTLSPEPKPASSTFAGAYQGTGAGPPSAGYADFLRGLFRNPRGVLAPTPSGPALAAAIAAEVDIARPGFVVELGPGTGVVTAALLDRGLAASRLITVEQDKGFVELLRRRFPSVKNWRGDAFNFENCLPARALVAAIVSGLPLLRFPPAIRQELLTKAFSCQGNDGLFVQLSYSWRPPVPPGPGMTLAKKCVWRNLPPAHVWTYRSAR